MKKRRVMIALLVLVSTMGLAQREFNANWRFSFSKDSTKVIQWLKEGEQKIIVEKGELNETITKVLEVRLDSFDIAPGLRKLSLDTIRELLWLEKGKREKLLSRTALPRKLRITGQDPFEAVYLVEKKKMIQTELRTEYQTAKYRDFFCGVIVGACGFLIIMGLLLYSEPKKMVRLIALTCLIFLWILSMISMQYFTTTKLLYTIEESLLLPSIAFVPSIIFLLLAFRKKQRREANQ